MGNKIRSFWKDSALTDSELSEKLKICSKQEAEGLNIYLANEKEKRDQYYRDLKVELASNLAFLKEKK